MMFLKQATASQSVLIGPFVDATDGATAETGLTIANTDIRLSANGGNLAAKNSGGGTHDEAGWYSITLDATDTATVGRLQLHCKMAGALMVHMEFQVLEEAVYDQLIGASALGYIANAPVNVAQISGDGTAADNAESFFDGTGYAGTNNVIPTVTNVTNLHASAATAAAQTTAQNDLDILTGTDGVTLATSQPNYAPATAAALATVDSNVDTLLTRITSTLFSGITSLAEWLGMIAGKQAGDATALTEIRGTGAGSGTFDPTTDSTEAVRDHVGDGTNLTEAGGDGDHLTEAGGTGDHLTALATAAALTTVDNEIAVIDGIVDNLNLGIIYGSAATGTLSITQATSDLTGYADDQLIGRTIIWTSGDAEGEATDITDYANTGGLLTFTALTTAPANGDTFKIV